MGEAMSIEAPVVHSDPEIMSGTPVFVGTRVPFQTLTPGALEESLTLN